MAGYPDNVDPGRECVHVQRNPPDGIARMRVVRCGDGPTHQVQHVDLELARYVRNRGNGGFQRSLDDTGWRSASGHDEEPGEQRRSDRSECTDERDGQPPRRTLR